MAWNCNDDNFDTIAFNNAMLQCGQNKYEERHCLCHTDNSLVAGAGDTDPGLTECWLQSSLPPHRWHAVRFNEPDKGYDV